MQQHASTPWQSNNHDCKTREKKKNFEENNGYMTVPPPPLFAVSIVSPETK
jgi:hypothetical protein